MFDLFRRFRTRKQQDVWSASVYFYGGILIVHANNRTLNNYGWNSQPVATVAVDSPREEIGSIIRRVVSESRWDAEAPDPEGADSPILVASGASSWRKLERNSKLVHVSLSDDEFTVVPNRAAKRGEGEGFIALPATATLSKTVDDVQLADTVFQAQEECVLWEPRAKTKAEN